MGWTVPLQRAAYRGVRFEVLSISDSFERATAEHLYPFINGGDVEDMGLQPRRVQLQAVFFGEGYRTDLDKLVAALQKQGADVLTHPIFGRMPNMLCQSANLRHGDEFVDYVALELSFVEATEAKPIFVFEHSLLSEIDKLLNQLEDFIDDVLALFAEVMKVVAFAHNVKGRLLKSWSAMVGVFETLVGLFSLNNPLFRLPSGVSAVNFPSQSAKGAKLIAQMIEQQFQQTVVLKPHANKGAKGAKVSKIVTASPYSAVFSLRSRFDEALRLGEKIKRQPLELATGKGDSAARSARLRQLATSFGVGEVQELDCLLKLLCAGALVRVGVEMIEADAETLTPTEIEYMANQMRLAIGEAMASVRVIQQQDVTPSAADLAQMNTAIYSQSQQTLERLRHLAHAVNQIAIAAINRKPPLIVRRSEINGTLVQVAHAFYGDYTRADELLRLNPQIRQPNFIQQGELINAYAK